MTCGSVLLGVLGLEPVEDGVLVEGGGGSTGAVVPLNVGDCVRVFHHLDEARFIPGGQAAIRDHPAGGGREVTTLRSPSPANKRLVRSKMAVLGHGEDYGYPLGFFGTTERCGIRVTTGFRCFVLRLSFDAPVTALGQ